MKQQLIRLKLIFQGASGRAEKPDDVSLILLIQMLDFVVEAFLKIIVHQFRTPQAFAGQPKDYYGKISELTKKPHPFQMNFCRAWDEALGRIRDPANNINLSDLPLRVDMDSLHKIRNRVQHESALPHPKDARKYVALVESFLKTGYRDIFGIGYDSLSAVSLVEDIQIRKRLEEAHAALDAGKWNEAAQEAAIAFHMLLELAGMIAGDDSLRSLRVPLFSTGPLEKGIRQHSEQIKHITRQIESIRKHLLITACGMDYVRYLEYRHICPRVLPLASGEYNVQFRGEHSEEDARRILDFVETQALHFQASGIYRGLAEQLREHRGY